jgi:hypothetical protein
MKDKLTSSGKTTSLIAKRSFGTTLPRGKPVAGYRYNTSLRTT